MYFWLLFAPVFAGALANLLTELVAGSSWAMLVVTVLFSAALVGIPLGLYQGRKLRNATFALLLGGGVFAFYQAGSRMEDLNKQQIGALPIATLCFGMFLVTAGIYLLYSEDIALFLRERRTTRFPQSNPNP